MEFQSHLNLYINRKLSELEPTYEYLMHVEPAMLKIIFQMPSNCNQKSENKIMLTISLPVFISLCACKELHILHNLHININIYIRASVQLYSNLCKFMCPCIFTRVNKNRGSRTWNSLSMAWADSSNFPWGFFLITYRFTEDPEWTSIRNVGFDWPCPNWIYNTWYQNIPKIR